jgi:hypothetical protein
MTISTPTRRPPTSNENTTLRELKLYNVAFHDEGSVRLLHSLAGLTQLYINNVSHLTLGLDDNESSDDEEGQNGEATGTLGIGENLFVNVLILSERTSRLTMHGR